jgi:hypothetical protein
MQMDSHETTGEAPSGAVNALRDKAAQCRRLACSIADRQTVEALNALAEEYERDASRSAG